MSEDRIAQLEHQLLIAQRRCEDLENRVMQAEASAERAVIESHLRTAALEAGSTTKPTSGSKEGPLEGVVRKAMREAKWKVDSQGKLYRVREEDGQIDMTTGGEYVSAMAWMKQHRKELPGCFPNHQSAAASQINGSAPSGQNPWSADAWNLTRQGEFIRDHGMEAAQKMAAAAGSKVTASSPPVRSSSPVTA